MKRRGREKGCTQWMKDMMKSQKKSWFGGNIWGCSRHLQLVVVFDEILTIDRNAIPMFGHHLCLKK